MDEKPSRRLAAVWFADIVGYTAVSSTDESRALKLVGVMRDVAEEAVRERGGRVVKHLGDAVMAEFSSCEAALEAALDVSEGFRTRSGSAGIDARLRIGAHLGELTVASDGDLYGDVVNTAARLQGEAEPDQVLVSDDVRRQLCRSPAYDFTDGGPRVLKGKDAPVSVWVARRRFQPSTATEAPEGVGEDGRKRLVVLPFEVLQPDPEVDFLAFGLPDAVSSSLMGLRSLVVRSPPALSHAERADPREVARAAGVDLVLSGAVQRAGDQVRVTARLAEGAGGTIVWNETSTMPLGDLFELQDALTRRIVSALAEPLTAGERQSMGRDVPVSGAAYELYLRANQVAVADHRWEEGIELYRAAIREDPDFAPAWARLGRCYRLRAKYRSGTVDVADHHERAEEAFRRALDLNPDLALAHSLYAQFQVESGRPLEGLLRLLRRAARHPTEVHLFVGLVHACRYCGLNAWSAKAHERARDLDPGIRTSVAYTLLQTGEPEAALGEAAPSDPSTIYALDSLGRVDEARMLFETLRSDAMSDVFEPFARAVLSAAEGDLDGALHHGRRAIDGFPDPEGRYFVARAWARVGAAEEAFEVLQSAVDAGFYCVDGLRTDPMFATLRDEPPFGALLERADSGRSTAGDVFRLERGEVILGGTASTGRE